MFGAGKFSEKNEYWKILCRKNYLHKGKLWRVKDSGENNADEGNNSCGKI